MRLAVQYGAPAEPRSAPVVIIAKAYPPCIASGAARPHRFAKYLSKFGYAAAVVAEGYQRDSRPYVYPAPGPRPSEISKAFSQLGDGVQRWIMPYSDSYPWLPFAIAEANRAVEETGAKIVISSSPPVANHLAAMALKLRHRVHWVADFRDPLWGNPFRTRRRAALHDRFIERLTFRFAEKVIANTDRLAMMWEQRHPRWKHKISVIWNGYDPEEALGPLALPPRDHKVLAHVGNIYQGRTPLPVLSSLARLMRSERVLSAPVKVQLIGTLEESSLPLTEEPCRTLLEQGRLEYSRDALPQNEARQLMSQADCLLLLDVNGVSEGLQVPAKIFEYVRIGRPILAFTGQGSPVEKILSVSGVPHTCVYPSMTPEAMDAALEGFLQLPSGPVAPSSHFVETFDGIRQTEALAREFDSLIGRPSLPLPDPATIGVGSVRS